MNGRIVNPLAPGHLTPWTDDTTPVVHDVAFTDPLTGKPVDPEHLSGSVAIAAAAYDSPPIAVPGRWYGMPIAPALVAWQLTSAKTGKPVIRDRVAADFRRGIPDEKYFWDYYAHGTYQNFPAVGLHYFAKTPGRFLFRLTHQPLDTLLVPAGDYDLTVDASDICGNTGSLATRVHVEAQPGQVEPAPPKPKPVPKPVPKPKVEVVPAPQPAKPRPQDLMHWPRLRGGYTVVLASIPRDRGERYAVHEARAALANGASRVGVLDTSRFPGLSRGFRVVFSGVYPDAGAASRAATSLAGSYPQAYVREIAPPILSWPRRRSAWTVVLASVPAGRGAHEGAHRKATEASALGLPRVGILETSRFRSLKRGYLVVYSGVYRTQERAQEAARRASGRFPNAYARWISAAR